MFDAHLPAIWSRVKRLKDAFAYPADPQTAARLQQEQFVAVRRNTPAMMAANVCNALVLVATLIDTPLAPRVLLWASAVLCVSGYIFLRARRRDGGVRREALEPTSVCRRALLNALILGGLWGAVPPLFFLDASPGARLMVISLTAGMLFGGAFALSRAPLAATLFAGLITLAAVATLLSSGDSDLSRIAFVLGVYAAVLLRNVFMEAASFRDRVLTQIGVEREARTDPLTGLANRLAFTDALEREIARVRRYGGGFLLLCIDIDNFKTINDRYGHPAGDELLSQAARRMRASLRTSDFIARLGGDEFAVIASDVVTQDAAEVLSERIVSCYDEPFLLEGRAVKGAASVGGAMAGHDTVDQRELFKCADVALYQSKQRGGGWSLFGDARDAAGPDDKAFEQDLRRALALGQFELLFQPVANLENGEIAGCEALLRWAHPNRGELAPRQFMALAERLGLAHEIGKWTLEQAALAAGRLPSRLRVAVRVSTKQLRRADFSESLLDAVAGATASPGRIEILVAERALSAPLEAAVLALSRAGFGVALDGFGCDSALRSLRRPPLDRIVVDGPLVHDASARKDCAAIVGGLAQMARELGVGVVARGIETTAQLQRLRELGCAEAMGDAVAPPMPLAAFEAFVSASRPGSLGERTALRTPA